MYRGPPDQLPSCLLDLNWEQTMESTGHFEPALSSVDGMAVHKLVGGLPHSHHLGVRLNSPPRPNLSMAGHFPQPQQAMGGLPNSGTPMPLTHLDQFSADLGRFSSFGGRNYGHLAAQFGLLGTEKLSRTASSQSLQTSRLPIGREIPAQNRLQLDVNNGESMNAREESSVSDPASREVSLGAPAWSSEKKRKAPPKGKAKEVGVANSAMDPPKVAEEDAKRCRSNEKNGNEDDAVKPKVEQNDGSSSNGNGGQKQGRNTAAKSPEPPKDYIHVRARRGQATDSHSLAERVRREKISQRMKLLQDLVPGCNKVTGKAVMLDEIINYVQSLQRQVEFLSMKLATVNPHLDIDSLANLLPKDMHQTCVYAPPPCVDHSQRGASLHCVLPDGMETQSAVNPLDSTFHQALGTHQPFLVGFESASSQLGTFWEDDLQNVTHMDMGQN
ncbi:hypothetical protein MUK42_12408 [Musa troglodytarum]|uniref:BHLH domain-containing protein n=1 Tax=Musa troglodytarum TaxID=320322 RepID=A0A9E7GT65_9LILI|nr:hypothetical protein MUK42_12408 [Musa troglodytarum]